MKILHHLLNRRKASPAETAQERLYRAAVRQIEARRCLGLSYPEQSAPYHRPENEGGRRLPRRAA